MLTWHMGYDPVCTEITRKLVTEFSGSCLKPSWKSLLSIPLLRGALQSTELAAGRAQVEGNLIQHKKKDFQKFED